MVAAELMGAVYWRLLQKLEARQIQVFGPAAAIEQATQTRADFPLLAALCRRLNRDSQLWQST